MTNKAFYILILGKQHPELKFGGHTSTKMNTQIFDEEVWKRISYEQLEIKFGIIPPLRDIQLIDKEDKFNVRIQLTGFFNKPVKQIEKYIKDYLMHLVIKK